MWGGELQTGLGRRPYGHLIMALPACIAAAFLGTGMLGAVFWAFGIVSFEMLLILFVAFTVGPLMFLALVPNDDDDGLERQEALDVARQIGIQGSVTTGRGDATECVTAKWNVPGK